MSVFYFNFAEKSILDEFPKNFQLGFRLSKFGDQNAVMTCAFRENWGHTSDSFRKVERQNFGTCYKIDSAGNFSKELNFEFSNAKETNIGTKPKLYRGEIMGTELLTLKDKFVINSPLVTLLEDKIQEEERSSGSIVEIPYGKNGSNSLIAKGLFTLIFRQGGVRHLLHHI